MYGDYLLAVTSTFNLHDIRLPTIYNARPNQQLRTNKQSKSENRTKKFVIFWSNQIIKNQFINALVTNDYLKSKCATFDAYACTDSRMENTNFQSFPNDSKMIDSNWKCFSIFISVLLKRQFIEWMVFFGDSICVLAFSRYINCFDRFSQINWSMLNWNMGTTEWRATMVWETDGSSTSFWIQTIMMMWMMNDTGFESTSNTRWCRRPFDLSYWRHST